jgi:hypothetical protein
MAKHKSSTEAAHVRLLCIYTYILRGNTIIYFKEGSYNTYSKREVTYMVHDIIRLYNIL